jgi:hypothetical protein
MERCSRCHGLYWGEWCGCQEFRIQYEEEVYTIRASNADQAAERFAEKQLISSEYSFLGDSIDFLVNGKAYRVAAEQSIRFSVNEL